MEEFPSGKKNSKKSRINEDDSRKNNSSTNNENVYEFLKEENKKALFDKLINNFNENFLTEQKLTKSRPSQIPYFKFDNNESINSKIEEEKINPKKENEDFEIIKL